MTPYDTYTTLTINSTDQTNVRLDPGSFASFVPSISATTTRANRFQISASQNAVTCINGTADSLSYLPQMAFSSRLGQDRVPNLVWSSCAPLLV